MVLLYQICRVVGEILLCQNFKKLESKIEKK